MQIKRIRVLYPFDAIRITGTVHVVRYRYTKKLATGVQCDILHIFPTMRCRLESETFGPTRSDECEYSFFQKSKTIHRKKSNYYLLSVFANIYRYLIFPFHKHRNTNNLRYTTLYLSNDEITATFVWRREGTPYYSV